MSGLRGSNPRPEAWEASALPAELNPLIRLRAAKIQKFSFHQNIFEIIFKLLKIFNALCRNATYHSVLVSISKRVLKIL